jgi:diadenosine tetraphosphatase ApaH/serine/threonine PP2A family protein phosphatase
MATRAATVAKLSADDRRFLADLPTTRMLALGGKRFLLVHASPRDPLDEYVAPDPEAWAARLGGVRADFVLVGHTHLPYVLTVGETTVVNPGSIGLQRDGDPRASYAVIEDGAVELKRVEYDVEAAAAAVAASDFDAAAKHILSDIYRTGRYVLPCPRVGLNGNGSYRNGHHANGTADPTPPDAANG